MLDQHLTDCHSQQSVMISAWEVLFHQGNVPCHKSMKTMVKLNEFSFELLPHPPYSPDLTSSDYWLFTNLKKMLQGKRFGSNEEVIAETEALF